MGTYKKQLLLLSIITVFLVAVVAACGSELDEQVNNTESESSSETVIYHGENGDIEVPANPERIAMLTNTYAGNLLALGITPIAINEYPQENKFYEGKLDDVEVITADSIEKLVELAPDLIITYSGDKNVKKYTKIAPTVTLTYEKYDYLSQHIEIGKLVGKEKEARAWVDEWLEKEKVMKEKVTKAIGENVTATIIETYGKDTYIYNQQSARGTEILYDALGLKAPEKLDPNGPPYLAISSEAISQYAGDYIFVGEGGSTTRNSFMETDVWKGLPAVKNNRVIGFDSQSFAYNDPISLEKEMEFIVNALTQGK